MANSSETTEPFLDLREESNSTRSSRRGRARAPEGQSTADWSNETERLLATTETVNRVPPTTNNPNNQITVSHTSIFLAFSVLVVFLAISMSQLSLYYQRQSLYDQLQNCEQKNRQLEEYNKELKEYNKELKDQNLALTKEVAGLREAVTHSNSTVAELEMQLKLTEAVLKMQHQEQLHALDRQRQEDQSQMQRRIQEAENNHKLEMNQMFEVNRCLTGDDSRPLLGAVQRMFRALFGHSNVDRCMQQISDRNRYLLT